MALDTPGVLVVGDGALCSAVASALNEHGTACDRIADTSSEETMRQRVRDAAARSPVIVGCSDGPGSLLRRLMTARDRTRQALVWCELTSTGARLQIVSPRAPDVGCPICEGYVRAQGDPVEAAAARYRAGSDVARARWRFGHRQTDLASAAAYVLLLVRNAGIAVAGGAVPDGRVHAVDVASRTIRAYDVHRHFACPECWPPRVSASDGLRDDVLRRWESDWATVRTPRALADVARAGQHLVDEDAGIFTRWTNGAADRRGVASLLQQRGVRRDETRFLDATRVVMQRWRTTARGIEQVVTEGFDFTDPDVAASLALLEGVERIFAQDYLDPLTIVRASHADVEDCAVGVRDFAMFSDEQYRDPGFPFRPPDPDMPLDWLWGIRLRTGAPVLVPADLIHGRAPHAVVEATSNGAACHSSLHHAVLNGLCEVVERDAFMHTWLSGQSRDRIALSAGDPDPDGVRAAFARMSFHVTHVDITTDLNIPVMLAVLEDDEDPAFFMSTMVAGSSRTRVLKKLYRELSQFAYPHLVDRAHYRSALSESMEPAGVRTLPDHVGFYQHATKRPLTAFLTASVTERRFADFGDDADASAIDEIQALTARLTRASFEPIVVDCTTPFVRALGLWVVKVVVPGLLPLSVGHGRAPMGSQRVSGALNPWPHPFW
jgi:ribosomal protein S12 methylthiotransferase accessory factor